MKELITIEKREDFDTMTKIYRVYFWRFLVYETRVTKEEMLSLKPPLKIRLLKKLWQFICHHKFEKEGNPWQAGFNGDGVVFFQIYACRCGVEEKRKFHLDVFRSPEPIRIY